MNEMFSMLDIAQRRGTDQVIGLIEEGIKVVPELATLLGRTITGTSYHQLIRTGRPSAGFRGANAGQALSKSAYTRKLVQCFILDAQMAMDKAVADADEFGRDSVLTDEAMGAFQAKLEAWSHRFYYGVADGIGFAGLADLIGPEMRVNAGGDTANKCTSAYLVWNATQGVHPIFGADGQITMDDEWRTQKITDSEGKWYDAYVNGTCGWVGLNFSAEAASRVANIDHDHPLTDKLIAQAIKLHPRAKAPSYILLNRTAAFSLQESRSAVTGSTGGVRSGQKTSAGVEVWAPSPTESNNVPIIVTDAIVDTEAVVSFA